MPLVARGFRELADILGSIPAELRAELTPAALNAGEIVAEQMRQNYGWSSAIGGTVQVSARFSIASGGAQIRVPERGYPHAGEVRTLEGNGVSPTTFRHRVYGSDNWVSMETRPSFYRAVEEKANEAVVPIAAAVERAFSFR